MAPFPREFFLRLLYVLHETRLWTLQYPHSFSLTSSEPRILAQEKDLHTAIASLSLIMWGSKLLASGCRGGLHHFLSFPDLSGGSWWIHLPFQCHYSMLSHQPHGGLYPSTERHVFSYKSISLQNPTKFLPLAIYLLQRDSHKTKVF